MSDKSLILALPEELIERASAAKLDLRQVLIEALKQKLPQSDEAISPSLDEIEAAIQNSMQRISLGKGDTRILGLHAGLLVANNDFDDPLPDEFWLNRHP
jgi:hypothetical protein